MATIVQHIQSPVVDFQSKSNTIDANDKNTTTNHHDDDDVDAKLTIFFRFVHGKVSIIFNCVCLCF